MRCVQNSCFCGNYIPNILPAKLAGVHYVRNYNLRVSFDFVKLNF